MAYEIHKLRKIQYAIETNGQYAIEITDPTEFTDIKALEDDATVELQVEMIDNKTMKQRIDGFNPKVNTRKRCNVSFTSYLNGTNEPIGIDVIPTSSAPNIEVLSVIMGGVLVNAGLGVVDNSTAGNIVLAQTNFIYPGSAIGLVNPTTGEMECARVFAISDSVGSGVTITASLSHNLGFTPASGSIMYGAGNVYLTQDPNRSLQFYVQGANSNDTWLAQGLNGGFSLKTELGQLPEISYKFEGGADWTAMPASGSFVPQNFTDATPPPFVDGYVSLGERQADPRNPTVTSQINVDTIEITPAIAYVDVTTQRGVGNILRKRRNRVVPVATAKIVTYFEDKSYFTARDNGTEYFLELQIGNQPGNTILISLPRVRITNVQVAATSSGLMGQEITFDIFEDDTSANFFLADQGAEYNQATYDFVGSAMSIHFL